MPKKRKPVNNEKVESQQTSESPPKKRKIEPENSNPSDSSNASNASNASNSSHSNLSQASPMDTDDEVAKEKKYSSEDLHENYFINSNLEGMRRDQVCDLGYASVISSSHPGKTLKEFLDMIISQRTKKGWKQSSKDIVDSLCYYIMGTQNSFDFYGYINDKRGKRASNLLGCFISEERWELVDITIDYLWKSIQACDQYKGRTREKLLSFIGKALILKYFKYDNYNREVPRNPRFHCKLIKTFFEKYKVDFNIETEDFELDSNRQVNYKDSYHGSDPMIKILQDKKAKYEYIEVMLMIGRKVSEKDFTLCLGGDYQSHEEASKILKLIVDRTDDMSDGVLEAAFAKNVNRDMIMVLLKRGCKPDLSKNLEILRKYALEYGLRDIYEDCCQRLEQQNPGYQKTLGPESHPIIGLLKSNFDITSFAWLQSLLSNHLHEVIDSPLFLKRFETWLLNYVLMDDEEMEPLPDEEKKSLLDILQKIFSTLRANRNISLIDKKFDSIEDHFVLLILENRKFNSTLLPEVLKAAIPEEDEELKTYHERRSNLLSEVFVKTYEILKAIKANEKPWKNIEMIYQHLINRGADSHRLLKAYIETYLGRWNSHLLAQGNNPPLLEKEFSDFFTQLCHQSKLNSKSLTKLLIDLSSRKEHFKQSMVPMLKMVTEIIKSPEGAESRLILDWDAILASYLCNAPLRVTNSYRNIPNSFALGVHLNVEQQKIVVIDRYEALELAGTQFLMQQNGDHLPKVMLIQDKAYTALEYIARINLTAKPVLLQKHEEFLKNTTYQNAMVIAKRDMSHRLFLEQIGITEIPKNHRSVIIERMAAEMKRLKGLRDHMLIPGMGSLSLQDRKNHILQLMWRKVQEKTSQDIQSFFSKKYETTDAAAIMKLSTISTVALLKNEDFILDKKREHEIWSLKSLRALSFLHRSIFLSNHSPQNKYLWASLYNNVAIIFANIFSEKAPLDKLIEGLSTIDEHYLKLSSENRDINQELFLNYLYCLIKTVPSVNLPTVSGEVLKERVMEFYQQKSMVQNLKLTPELVEKHRMEFDQSMESDITWGYIAKKELDEVFATLLSTPTAGPLDNSQGASMLLQYSALQMGHDDALMQDQDMSLNANSNSNSNSSSSAHPDSFK